MRKKNAWKKANKSGTSTKEFEKAEKALHEYHFLNWLDNFLQPRNGRTNLKSKGNSQESTNEDGYDNTGEIEGDSEEEDDNVDEDAAYDNDNDCDNGSDLEEQFQETEDEQESQGNTVPSVESIRDVPSKEAKSDNSKMKQKDPSTAPTAKKAKKRIQGAAKEALMEEMEFSLISKMNSTMNDRLKRKKEKEMAQPKIEIDNEDAFCQALALDLKQLPMYERCIAKQELRNVLFKQQMAVMNRQTPNYCNQSNTTQSTNQLNTTPTFNRQPMSLTPSGSQYSSPAQPSPPIISPPNTPIPQQNSWMWHLQNNEQSHS